MSMIPGQHWCMMIVLAVGASLLAWRRETRFEPPSATAPAEWLSTYREACSLRHIQAEAFWFANPDYPGWSSWFFVGTPAVPRTVGTCQKLDSQSDFCLHALSAQRIGSTDHKGVQLDVYMLLEVRLPPNSANELDWQENELLERAWVVLIQRECPHINGLPWNLAAEVDESTIAAWAAESPDPSVVSFSRRKDIFNTTTREETVVVRDRADRVVAMLALPRPAKGKQ